MSPERSAAKPPIRVALVDDHPAVLAGLERLVRRAPGLELVGSLADHGTLSTLLDTREVDVVVLDYDLERGDGLTACLRVKQRGEPPAVAVYSGYAGPGISLVAAAAGADALISKAEPVPRLLDVIRRVARGERLLAPPAREMRELASCRLRPEDLAVMSMLLDGVRTADIATALGVDPHEADRRARRVVDVLQVRPAEAA